MSHSIITWNTRSLTSDKVESLRRTLKVQRPLAVVLTETHRSSASPVDWPRFRGYTLYPLPGRSRHAGGMAVLLRADCLSWNGPGDNGIIDGLNVDAHSAALPNTSSQWAAFELHVHGHSHPIWLVGVYLQPPVSAEVRTELTRQLRTAVERHTRTAAGVRDAPQLVLCGDFNQHDVCLCAADDSAHSQLLVDLLQLGFRCCNSPAPGNFTHSNGSVLDLFLELVHPAAPPLVRCLQVDNSAQPQLPGSDHFAILATLYCQVAPLQSPHTFYKWRTESLAVEDAQAFVEHIERVCIGAPLDSQEPLENPLVQQLLAAFVPLCDFQVSRRLAAPVSQATYKDKALPLADTAWEALSDMLHALAVRHIGQRPRTSTEERGWTKELHRRYKALLRAERRWRNDRTNSELAAMRAATQQDFRTAFAERQRVRWDELRAAVEDAPPQRRSRIAWSAFSKYRRARELSQFVGAGVKRADGTAAMTEDDSRRALAAHFKQQMSLHDRNGAKAVDTSDSQFALLHDAAPPYDCKVEDLPADSTLTDVDAFRLVLADTDTKTAAGPDELTGAILRLAAQSDAFMRCVTLLVNFCYAFHVLPQGWRDANLMPLLKKNGDPRSCGAYRPISITSLLMRRVERMMEKRVKDRLEKQLSPWQAGFRRCRSTKQQVLYLQHKIATGSRRSSSHNAIPYPVVFLDISRAFDSVPHEFLLHKLFRLGIRGHDLQFFSAYLSARRFRVVTLNGMDSSWTDVPAGVPQGGVLSPLLYAVFINDSHAPGNADTAFRRCAGHLLYADDMALAPSVKHDVVHRHAQLQTALTSLGEWAQRWGVRFSAAKSGVLWFHKTGTSKATIAAAHALPPLTVPHAAGQPPIQLPLVQEYQYLGVWFNAKLSAHAHFRHMVQKCTPMSALLRGVQSPNAPPGADVVRRLVKAVLLTRITYALPFFTPTKQMCARLDSLLFRPLLTALALPQSVHRASLAVYTELPVVQLQRDKELVALVGSILSLVNEPTIRGNPSSLPVFRLLFRHCNASSAARRLCRQDSRPHYSRYADWDSRSPVDVFLQAAARLGMCGLLPDRSLLTARRPPPWNYGRWKAALSFTVHVRSLERLLNESRGYEYSFRGWRFGRLTSVCSSEALKRGAMLPPLLGVPSAQRVELPHTVLLRSAIDLVNHKLSFSARTLSEDLKRHAQLRARITLNRAAFHAVRASRSKDPLAPRRCRQCPATPPETARHVLVSCPRYAASRDELKQKLAALIERIRKARDKQAHWRRCIQDDDELLFHIILATPFVLSVLNKTEDRLYLLHSTGNFLLSVHDIRPP